MLHDLREALRRITRRRWLTAVIVSSLALGTGANAAVYSAVDALLFRAPAGVDDAASLVELFTSQVNGASYGFTSYPDYRSIAGAAPLESIGAIDEREEATVARADATITLRVAAVSDAFWDVLRMHPSLGSWPSSTDSVPGAAISTDAWHTLGADPQIVGRAITVDGREYVVRAVAPARFRGIYMDRVFDVWVPLDRDAAGETRGQRHLKIIGRLAEGTTLAGLEISLDGLAQNLAAAYPATNRGTLRSEDAPRRFTAIRYSRVAPEARRQLALLTAILFGATCLLLVSACVNAGSLLLSRGLARRAELTIRVALGAGRARLMRQLLFESVLLTMGGAAGGVLVAVWTAGALSSLFAPEHAALLDTRVRPAVMLATLAVGMAAGVVCGLAPAVASTRALSPDVLRGDPGRTGERHGSARLRMTLVGAQLALSTLFLIGAVVLTRAVDDALQFNPLRIGGPIVLGSVETFDPGFRAAATERLQNVRSASLAGWVAAPPLARTSRRTFIVTHGGAREPIEIDINFATNEYFRVMFMPLVDGRLFARADDAAAGEVAVVNEALAQRYFADRAVGRTLTDALGRTVEIVGVVRTRSFRAFEGPQRPMVFFPMSRATARGFYVAVRTRDDAERIEADLMGALRGAGSYRKLEVLTFETHLARAIAADRLVVTLVAACGVLALGLAVLGVYGVVTDLVRRRTREIGLRIALGAAPRHIVTDYVATTLTPAFGGVAAGVLGAVLLLRVARSIVFGLPSIDPVLVIAMIGMLSLIVIAAVVPPARRAVRVSPLLAFRQQT